MEGIAADCVGLAVACAVRLWRAIWPHSAAEVVDDLEGHVHAAACCLECVAVACVLPVFASHTDQVRQPQELVVFDRVEVETVSHARR